MAKPYWHIPIQDCGDPLVPIPLADFAHAPEHDYQCLGAPYGAVSPYSVRASVLSALYTAQAAIASHQPHWQLFIFDAYRPLAVQAFMANYTFEQAIADRHLDPRTLSEAERAALWQEVYDLWAPPNDNPLTPPPHSTGAAVDVTLYDCQTQTCVEMGSPIDELSPRSAPDYFAQQVQAGDLNSEALALAKTADWNRQFLAQAMLEAGFQRHPGEWWHFCLGDQMWVWLSYSLEKKPIPAARYGRYDLISS